MNNSLSCSFYIKEITSKLVKFTYQLARIKHFIDDGGQKMFYHVMSTINLSMEYCFWDAVAHQLRFLKTGCILSLQTLTDFQRSLLIMKSINDKVPQYIKALFTLCLNDNNRFRLRLSRLDVFKIHSIPFSATISWNSLSVSIRGPIRSISLNNFKRKLGKYLLSKVH